MLLVCPVYSRYLTPLLIAVQYIPLDPPLLMKYRDSEIEPDASHSIRPPELVVVAIPLIQLLTPTVFNLSHSALFIDNDTKTSRRRRLFPTCRLWLVQHPWRD